MFLHCLCFLLLMDVAYVRAGDTKPTMPEDSQLGWFPYVVSLRVNNEHRCGGSIISPTHILTAAHCLTNYLSNPSQMVVVTSTIYLNSGGETHRVAAMYRAPNYPGDDEADVGVIKLADEIIYNSNQRAIPLSTTVPPENDYGLLVGWGELPGQHRLSNIQQFLYVWMMDNVKCRAFYPQGRGQHICTSTQQLHYGVCGGDSGSPLVYNNQVVGITSRGDCAAQRPDIFATVFHNLNFIQSAMAS